jgi:hypothetical protein
MCLDHNQSWSFHLIVKQITSKSRLSRLPVHVRLLQNMSSDRTVPGHCAQVNEATLLTKKDQKKEFTL